ncbi:GerAB/ArcD/ProY family transporter [Paenibacillus sp. YPG26]|uniref:GerAB/ArcD/ProY family transporter n=1 Tax=Paenibacillus sp. YPG26 TaxID=2878915 RepID=UPI002041E982|nr:GerAB/ArcD/ProY family transporter [Paenibacillus sp. YPG26]USB33999.1 GerAB/ArcD/ProY family transporter [Paenibacillus sp. YPG26]
MVKNKYIYYLFLINALINVINFVPRGLIAQRFNGAAMAIVVSVPIGLTLMYLCVKMMNKFPGEGLPEILNANFPRLVSKVMLFGHTLFWYFAGLITLVAFVDVTMRYITSDVSPLLIMVGFLVVVCLAIRLTSESILYGLEVLIVINVPIIIYVLFKALLNPMFSWDAVMQVITYSLKAPSYGAIAQATFIFTGYLNLAVFNRVFDKVRIRQLWLIGIFGFLTLVVTVFIPIGYQGTINVERHVYPWFSTADVLRTKNFIIERVLFFFYFTYLTLSLVSSIIHWHVALEMFKGLFTTKEKKKRKIDPEWWMILAFCAAALILMNTNQFVRDRAGLLYLDGRLIAEMILIFSLYLAHKRRRAKKRE